MPAVVLEEFLKVEFLHPERGTSHVDGIDEVALDSGDVCYWQMCNGSVFEVGCVSGDFCFGHLADGCACGDHVHV